MLVHPCEPILRSSIEGSSLSAVLNFRFWPWRKPEGEFIFRIAHRACWAWRCRKITVVIEWMAAAHPWLRAVRRVRGEAADASMAHIPYFRTKHMHHTLLTASNKYLETNFWFREMFFVSFRSSIGWWCGWFFVKWALSSINCSCGALIFRRA